MSSPDTSPVPTAVDLHELLTLLRERLAAPAELLTRESLAALLDLGVSTLDRLSAAGKIGPRSFKLAGLKWHRQEVLAWLAQRDNSGELHDVKSWPVVWESIQRHSHTKGQRAG